MLSRVVYKKHRGRRLLTSLAAFGLVAGTLLATSSVLAVHDTGVFQMDGNAQTSVQSNPVAAEDWDLICKANPSTCTFATGYTVPSGATTAVASSHVADGVEASIFTGGGSKDPQDLPNWKWKDGSVPDKDNLQHAFAARYSKPVTTNCPSTLPTCELIYFGSDRFDNSGDAQQGFWFFQKKVVAVGGIFTNGAGQPATHTNGDLLILSDFSNGGTVSTINLYKWVNGALQFIAGGDALKCSAALAAGDPFCGIVNPTNGTIAPWTFTDKAGNHSYLQGELYEAGVNLGAPTIGLGNECFSSFMAETRSSTSTTATLKDFVLAQLAVCGASLSTQVSNPSFEIGGSVTDAATIHISGGATPPAPTGSVSFFICGPGATSCSSSGTSAGSKPLSGAVKVGNDYTVTSNPYTPTAAGTYCFAATWPGDGNYSGPFADNGTGECFTVTPKQPTIVTNATAGPVTPGTPISDTATLGNTATPSTGTGGTITFHAYSDSLCATSVYTSVVSNVTANGNYNSQTDGNGGIFAPTAPGTYYWIASYVPGTGDVNNLSATTICGDPNEASVVQQFNPTLSTAQTVTVKDTVTLSDGGGGGNLKGTLHVQLFRDSTCTGTPVSGVQDFAVDHPSGQTFTTTPLTITAPGEATLYWQVSFDSTNPAQTSIAASCSENSSLVIND